MLVENYEEALPWFERYRSLRKAAADVRAYRDRAKAVRVRLEVTGDGLHSVTTFENADENRVALDLIEAALAVVALKLAECSVFVGEVSSGTPKAVVGECAERVPSEDASSMSAEAMAGTVKPEVAEDPIKGPPWVVVARSINRAEDPEKRVIVSYFRGWDSGVDVWNENLELAVRFYEEQRAQEIANVFSLIGMPDTIFNICTLEVARRFVLTREKLSAGERATWSAFDLGVLQKQLKDMGGLNDDFLASGGERVPSEWDHYILVDQTDPKQERYFAGWALSGGPRWTISRQDAKRFESERTVTAAGQTIRLRQPDLVLFSQRGGGRP